MIFFDDLLTDDISSCSSVDRTRLPLPASASWLCRILHHAVNCLVHLGVWRRLYRRLLNPHCLDNGILHHLPQKFPTPGPTPDPASFVSTESTSAETARWSFHLSVGICGIQFSSNTDVGSDSTTSSNGDSESLPCYTYKSSFVVLVSEFSCPVPVVDSSFGSSSKTWLARAP